VIRAVQGSVIMIVGLMLTFCRMFLESFLTEVISYRRKVFETPLL